MKKRLLSVLLCLCMVVGMLPVMTPTAQASTNGHTRDEAVAWVLNKEKTAIDYDGAYGAQCVDLIFMYYDFLGQYSRGYAYEYMRNDVPRGWNRYTSSETTPQPGDIVVFDAGYYRKSIDWTQDSNGHVGLVYAADNSHYYFLDYKGWSKDNKFTNGQKRTAIIDDFSCVIRPDWPPSHPTAPSQRVTYNGRVADNFIARIYNQYSGCYLENRDGNVQTANSDPYDPRQIWQFIHDDSRGSYKIVNMYDGWCLDACDFGTSFGTNVQTHVSNDSDAERWWLCGPSSEIGRYSQFYFVPRYAGDHGLVMDITGGDQPTYAGTNIQLFYNHYWDDGRHHIAQDFRIIKDNSYSKPAKPATPTFQTLSGTPERSIISWYAVAPVNAYDSREYILEIYDVTNSQYVLRNQHVIGTSYTAALPVGSYRAEIQAVNTNYPDWKSGWNMRYFTVYPSHTVTMTATPAEGGTVSPSETYSHGDFNTLVAKPNEGWKVAGWTRNGQPFNGWTGNPEKWTEYGLTVTADETFAVTFERLPAPEPPTPAYAVRVSATEGGSAAGGGTYDAGASVTVTAEAHEGYNFTGWSENGSIVSTEASYTFHAAEARSLTAVFAAKPLPTCIITVTASPAEGGSVSGGGNSIEQGTAVTAAATANAGYTFKCWEEAGRAVSSDASYTFTAGADRTLTAVFEQTPAAVTRYTITVTSSTGGIVSGGGTYDENQQVTIAAVPASGYRFVEWRENGTRVSENASYDITANGNRAFSAVFEPLPVNYTVGVTAADGGTVTGGGSYRAGTSVTVTATPASGYQFVEWQENETKASGDASYSFVLNKHRTLTAVFEKVGIPPVSCIVSLSATPGGTVTGSGSYGIDAAVTVTAEPADGYHFVEWQENNKAISDNASYRFTITGSRTLRAVFAPDMPVQVIRYSVETSAIPAEGGTVTGGGTFEAGNEVTVTAAPKAGYRFLRWMADGGEVSTDQSYTFTVSESLRLTAVFEKTETTPPAPGTYTVNISAAAGGTVSGGGTFTENSAVTVTAAANSSYRFAGWFENGSMVSASASYTFTVSADRTLVAEFTYTGNSSNPGSNPGDNPPGSSPTGYTVTAPSRLTGGTVTVTPAHARERQRVTIAVTAAAGYVLDTLTASDHRGNPLELTDEGGGRYTFTMPGSRVTVEASFAEISPSPAEPEPPAEPAVSFVDAVPGSYYYDALVWAVEQEITSGTGAAVFGPDASCTRAQMVTLLWRAAGSPAPQGGTNPFTDVRHGAYYEDAVLWAAEQGVTAGTSATAFSPDGIVTRAQAVTFLYRAAGSPAAGGSGLFGDVAPDAYYAAAVRWATGRGVTTGTSAAAFSPDSICTRAQIVTFLYRDRVKGSGTETA